jgi:hypothetical protein
LTGSRSAGKALNVFCQVGPPIATSNPPPYTQEVRASRWLSSIAVVAMLSKIMQSSDASTCGRVARSSTSM